MTLEEFNKELNNKKVAILGLGVSNLPLIDYLVKYNADITVFDQKELSELDREYQDKIKEYNIKYIGKKDFVKEVKDFELVFRSPSILPSIKELQELKAKGAIVTTEIELLMKLIPSKIIGITGSDGKTTTTTLIYECLKANNYNVFLGGNIGIPLFTKAGLMTKDDIVVLELSSFQLMNMEVSPNIAVITNITPNHLNVHKDMNEYIEAKKEIMKHQTKDDLLVVNYDSEITRTIGVSAIGRVKYFSSKQKLENGYYYQDGYIYKAINGQSREILKTSDLKLRGVHNFENICTTLSAIEELIDIDKTINVLKDFTGVEHRLEFVREINGIKWYNDSVSSSPTRTIAGLNAYDEDIVLIAGGYDKNIDYDVIGKPIVDKVTTLILLGDTKEKIYNAVIKAEREENKTINKFICNSLEEAVFKAKEMAHGKEIVLFSPASASFDMFKNFADRGEKFKKLVNSL